MKILPAVCVGALLVAAGCSRDAAPGIPSGDVASSAAATRIPDATFPSATITEYPIPTSDAGAIHIVSAPAKTKALWFTEYNGNKLGFVTTAGKITEYPVNRATGTARHTDALRLRQPFVTVPPSGNAPYGIVVAADQHIWFSDELASAKNLAVRVSTSGFKAYAATQECCIQNLVNAPKKTLWYATSDTQGNDGADVVSQITLTGKVTAYQLPSGSAPGGITAGPDGALWFTESGSAGIGRITTAGSLHGYPTPTAGSEPYFITVGPDKALWFTEYGANNIGRLAIKS